jgi:hypothetical protein
MMYMFNFTGCDLLGQKLEYGADGIGRKDERIGLEGMIYSGDKVSLVSSPAS